MQGFAYGPVFESAYKAGVGLDRFFRRGLGFCKTNPMTAWVVIPGEENAWEPPMNADLSG